MNKTINFLLICMFFIWFGESIGFIMIKKEVAVLKEKKAIKPSYSFIKNIPDIIKSEEINYIYPDKEIKSVIKDKVNEYVIEPKKIVPDQLNMIEQKILIPERLIIKSKINVTKTP